MKYIFFLASLFMLINAHTDHPANPDLSWSVVKRSPFFSFSAEFDCKKGDIYEGRALRTWAGCPRYYYDLYDSQDELKVRGITRALSVGMLSSSAMDIDVYDNDICIGLIEGKVFTRARAKFIFYDADGLEVGNAYLNTESAEFIITAPFDESIILGQLKGRDFGDLASWELVLNHPSTIDERLLKIFTIFVADYHHHFLPRPKTVHHHHYHIQRR
jgi:hypothetical protein